MTIPRHIAVIDIGKTNAKVVLIDSTTSTQLASRSTPNVVRRDGPYPHADVEMLWRFICDSLTALHAEHRMDGISITTHGATAALMAGDELALPVLDYEHPIVPEGYEAVRPPFAETLSPRLPGGLNLGAQLFWQAQTFPAEFSRVTAILTYPQYWAFRLTGAPASELTSLGCHTDLWAPDRNAFSTLVDTMGWRSLFPPIRPAISTIGTLRPELGLPSLPVTTGIHDSNASLLPHLGRHAEPFTILSTGTWSIAMTVGGPTYALDPGRDSLANVDAHGRPVPTARFMGGREFDLLVPQIAEPSEADIELVIDQAIMALPSFTPGVGPYPDHQGRWTVDPDTLTPAQRTAAASLYLALMARTCLSLCGLGRSITLEGPLARNQLFGAALTQLTGVPVHASGDATGTSLGASLLFGGSLSQGEPGAPIAPLNIPGFDAYSERWHQRLAP
ncbi:FGGY-family carbohydrate kinase [Devosia rhizoryzae]|uniref:FGGY-family carbohydrate kinase n=1 Tax=Devosia rhizoryzae TaxID=2774137 RepID=A0ABX7C2C7_9HYPH|nr:FGGY-family carbohydrate kinase [Devosia rhizoryzae]QQR37918.1 FGGY-family carbohydrate kinase [Devosia rhizoryzae]